MKKLIKKKEHKMKLLKLTKKSDASVLYVNADKVVAFDTAVGGGTRLVFDEVFAYVVAESLEEVLSKLLGCGRAKSE